MIPLLLAVLSAAPTSDEVERAIAHQREATTRSVPSRDAALDRAAAQIAASALTGGVDRAVGLLAITRAVSRAGGWEPTPVAVVLRATTDDALHAVEAQPELAATTAAVMGLGVASADGRTAICVLLGKREAQLGPFPRASPRPPAQPPRLCARLRPPLAQGEVFVTEPGGTVSRLPLAKVKDVWCTDVAMPRAGRYTIEVLGVGPAGPEVTALFFSDVGQVDEERDDDAREPTSGAAARAAVLTRTNALRSTMGLGALAADEKLDAIAERYARRMASEGFFAHVAPDGSDLKARLAERGYAYRSAGENLGLSQGPLSAHFGIEHSPGHRKNLLEPETTHMGVGLGLRPDGLTVLVEVFAAPVTAETRDPLLLIAEGLARTRSQHHLPPLRRDVRLDALAQEHARAALSLDVPHVELPGRRKLHDRVFELVDEARSVAVDMVVTQAAGALPESKNVLDARNRLVGIGAVQGDSPSIGPGRLWVVIIYAAPRDGS
jgi:uncharacterized protein YkwD